MTKQEIINKSEELKKMIEEWDDEFIFDNDNDTYSKEIKNEVAAKLDAVYRSMRKMQIALTKIEG